MENETFRHKIQLKEFVVIEVTLHFIGKPERVSGEKPVAIVFQKGTPLYLDNMAWYSD